MKSDADFRADFTRGMENTNRFFKRVRQNGVNAYVMPWTFRPDSSQRKQHTDEGDGIVQLRVEYKKRDKLHFTNAKDYKYPTVLVDEVYNYHQKTTRWLFYAIENAAGTHVALIHWFTVPSWKIEQKPDKRQGGRLCDFYACPKDRVMFMPISWLFVAPEPAADAEAAA